MAGSPRRISPLSDDVRAQLWSSIEIASHEQVVTGLLENALDANAKSISVHLDLARGYFSMLDDGTGIQEVEFSESGYLGRMNCTSKSESSVDSYGRLGRFLSCLSVIALLSITSRHKSETHASRLILRRGQVVHRKLRLDESGFDIGRSGTKIEVHNLFGDIPVRSRHMYDRYSSTAEIERTFDLLRATLAGYLLACSGQIDLCCIVNGTTRKLVHRRPNPLECPSQLTPEMVASVLSQTRSGPTMDSKSWRYASVRTPKYFISAAISMDAAPSPIHQYLTLGEIPVHAREDHSLLFKTINDRFQASNFGQDSDSSRSKRTEIMSQGVINHSQGHVTTPKRVDRWPMFYIRVDGLQHHEARKLSQEIASFALKDVNNSLTQALESLISHFLEAEGWKAASRTTSSQQHSQSHQKYDANKNLPILTRKTTKLANIDTTSQFSQWHRIKSGRSKPEDIEYGLPFAKSTRNLCTETELARDGQLLCENLSFDEIDLDTPISEESLSTSDEGGTADLHSLPKVQEDSPGGTSVWTNHRNGRTIHIHSRTGATISDGHQQLNTTIPLSSQAVRSSKKFQTHTLGLHNSDKSRLAQPGGDRTLNLTSYREAHVLRREAAITTIGPDGHSALNEKASTYLFRESHQVSKENLPQATVLGQVDKKFILITVKSLLILIDQHAADERVKLEQLCYESCIENSVNLGQPLVFEIEEDEAPLFQVWQEYFQKWHISYQLVEDCRSKQLGQDQDLKQGVFSIRVDALPKLIAERCRAEPKLLIELLRNELFSDRAQSKLDTCSQSGSELRRSWLSIASSCPVGVLELLKSRSCRTAIMFNDILDISECEELVRRLGKCDLPFQCAHGRPTLTVLTEFGLLGQQSENRAAGAEAPGHRTVGFGAAWQKWISGS